MNRMDHCGRWPSCSSCWSSWTGYVKASPDTAYIISGMRKTPKVLIGKAGVKVPFFEEKDELSLQLIPIDVKTSSAVPTADYINIKVDAAVNVKISDTPDLLDLAAQNFLNRKVDYIASVAREVLEGQHARDRGQNGAAGRWFPTARNSPPR